jgi:hypothetical protein
MQTQGELPDAEPRLSCMAGTRRIREDIYPRMRHTRPCFTPRTEAVASMAEPVGQSGPSGGWPCATNRNAKSKRDGVPGAGGTTENAHEDETLHLLAEEVSGGKETRETGRVRVATRTHEREALVDEDLAREHVEIERVPVGRRVDAVPDVRQEGDTMVVPVMEEILHVQQLPPNTSNRLFQRSNDGRGPCG